MSACFSCRDTVMDQVGSPVGWVLVVVSIRINQGKRFMRHSPGKFCAWSESCPLTVES